MCRLWVGSHLKFTIWFSNITRNRSLMSSKRSFSSTFTVLSPSGLWGSHPHTLTQLKPCRGSSYVTSHRSPIGEKKKKKNTGRKLPAPKELTANCVRFVSWVPFVLHIHINGSVSPFLPLKEWHFGILSLSKLEYACSFRGSARIWALGALWGH